MSILLGETAATAVNVDAPNGRLVIDASQGVGSANALETTVASLDIDNDRGTADGNIQIIETDGVVIQQLDNDDTDGQTFTANTISTTADGARSVFSIDLDGDGDIDVLSASFNDDKIAWYENDGSQNFTERVISTTADNALSVFAIDVDGDGDIDVLSASGADDKIAWYENDGSQNFTERVISTAADWGPERVCNGRGR